jgi:hypothetical protein
MPEAHQKHFAGGDAVTAWGASVGPMTEAMVRRLLDANPVREQGWRSAKGLQRLVKKYGESRVEAACALALHFGARSYKPVERLSTVVTSQLPVTKWHEWIGNPTWPTPSSSGSSTTPTSWT